MQEIPSPPASRPHPGEQVLALLQQGQLQAAFDLVRQVLAAEPRHAALLNLAGIVALRLGRIAEAQNYWQAAIGIQPGFADAHGNLAVLFNQLKRYPEAETSYRTALACRPDYAEAHCNLGNLLMETERLSEAEMSYRKAIELRPDYADAHFNLGNLLQVLQRYPEAETVYRQALACQPGSAKTHANLGILLQALRRYEEAEASYRQALECLPGHAETHYNLGNLFKDLGRHAEAEAAYRRALEFRPDFADAHRNLGVVYQEQKRYTEAESCYRQAKECRPNYPEAWYNLATLFDECKRLPDAEAAYRRALELRPGYPEAKFNLSFLLLASGRYAEAWPLYESRYDKDHSQRTTSLPMLPFPQWKGESLRGKSLLVWPEQGFGDEIQFIRYLPVLRAAGAKHITLVCRPPLKRLFDLSGIADLVLSGQDCEQLQAHDYWTLAMSMPLHLGTTPETIPASLPYLTVPPDLRQAWQARLARQDGLRVGLVWKGKPQHKNDKHRSLASLSSLAPLWSVPGLSFVSLQKGEGEDEAAAPPAGQPLLPLGSDIADFADSAAIVSQLDLVICVDTAIAHLAGALGIPCWVLLPHAGTDWRWLQDRSDSPWYPQVMRLFRQPPSGDWSATVLEVTDALRQFRKQ